MAQTGTRAVKQPKCPLLFSYFIPIEGFYETSIICCVYLDSNNKPISQFYFLAMYAAIFLIIKIILSLAFLLTGGVLFSDWGKQHRSLVIIASLLGLAGSYYLSLSLYDDFKRYFPGEPVTELTAPRDQPKSPITEEPSIEPAIVEVENFVEQFGPNDSIAVLAVSPTQAEVAIVTSPNSSRDELSLWNYQTGKHIKTLAKNLKPVRKLYWAKDGRSLYVQEQQRVLEFHLPSNQRRTLAKDLYDLRFISIREGRLDWIGMPFPVRYPLSEEPGNFKQLEEKFRLDNFDYFQPLEKKEGKSDFSLALSPQAILESRKERDRIIEQRARTSSCVRPIGNLPINTSKAEAILYDNVSFCVWDTKKGSPLRVVQRDEVNAIRTATISRDGNLIALGTEVGDIDIWDSNSWTKLRTLSGHIAAISGLAFNQDGSMLISSEYTGSGQIIAWDVLRGTQIAQYTLDDESFVDHLAFSNNEKHFLAAAYNVYNLKLP